MKKDEIDYSRIPKMEEDELEETFKKFFDVEITVDHAKLKEVLYKMYSEEEAKNWFDYIIGRRVEIAARVKINDKLQKKPERFYGKVRKLIEKLLSKKQERQKRKGQIQKDKIKNMMNVSIRKVNKYK